MPVAAWAVAALLVPVLALSVAIALFVAADGDAVVVDITFAGGDGFGGGEPERVTVGVQVSEPGNLDVDQPVRLLGTLTGAAAADVHVASVEGHDTVPLELVDGQFLFPSEAQTLTRRDLAEAETFPLELTVAEGEGPLELAVSLVSDEPVPPEIVRLGGSQRYETAVSASEQAYPEGADTVYVARTFAFADALAAGSAAAGEGAPLLLAFEDGLPVDTRAEIARLAPSRVVLVGGGAALSDAVRGELSELVDDTQRIAGRNRYDTAARVALDAFDAPETVLIASGQDPGAALAAGAGAAAERAPVLLARQSRLPEATRRALAELGPERVIVLGGRDAIGTPVIRELHALADDVQRMAGDTIYETALEVASAAFDDEAVSAVVLASDLDFHEALIAAAAAAAFDAPMLLTQWDAAPDPVLDHLGTLELERIYAVGAPSRDVLTAVRAATTPDRLTPDRARPFGEPATTTLGADAA